MADVYENAFLTVADTKASNRAEGCFSRTKLKSATRKSHLGIFMYEKCCQDFHTVASVTVTGLCFREHGHFKNAFYLVASWILMLKRLAGPVQLQEDVRAKVTMGPELPYLIILMIIRNFNETLCIVGEVP